VPASLTCMNPTAINVVRRRSSGLTQVDVARMAGIGRRTYQQFEQGQVRPTPEVFAAVVSALGLSQGEVERLRYLVDLPEPAEQQLMLQTVSATTVMPLMTAFQVPAVIYDATMTVLAGNEAAARMAPGLVGDGEPVNLLRWLFTVDAARALFVDFDDVAREAVGRFRVSQSRLGHPTALDALADDLRRLSPLARRLWDDDALGFEAGRDTFRMRGPDGAVHTMSFATVALLGDVPAGLRMSYGLSEWPPSEPTAQQLRECPI